MKTAVWVMFFVFAVAPIYGNADNGHPEKDQRSTINVADSFSRFNLEGIGVIYQQASETQSDRAKEQPNSYFKRMFSAENANQWVLCIVGTIGIIVALRTLKQIRRQTDILVEYNKATREAADAAKDNARAVINSQRARIAVEVNRIDKAIERVGRFRFEAVATNTGSTVAEVIGVWARIHHCGIEVLRDFENASLPEPVDGAFREPRIIHAHEKWLFRTIDSSDLVPFEVQHKIEGGTLYPVWYGWVQFRDFVGKEHRQRFFFMYSEKSKKLLPVGPTGQNAEEY